MGSRNLTVAYWLVVFLGVSLWIINWLANRPLFIDEANVARNLFDRSFAELFTPLDHQQYAPPVYLVLAKGCGELFGYSERSLRIPSLLGGLIAVISLTQARKYLDLKGWMLLPLLLLFVNPTVLRFVGEIKPYSLDMGVASVILVFAIKDREPSWKWVAMGVIAVWISLPSVFILAAVGLTALYADKQKYFWTWVGISSNWLLSFTILYFSVLRHSISSGYLKNFHDPYFFSLPFTENFSYVKSITLLLAQPRLAFGFTTLAILWSVIVIFFALIKAKIQSSTLLILPVIAVFFASSLGYYSLIPRLMLFTLPGWWLLAALASCKIFEKFGTSGYYKFIPIILWGFTVTGTNIARHYFSPMKFSDSRILTTGYDEGYKPVLNDTSLPVYDYYNRVHPKYRNESHLQELTIIDLRSQPQPGQYVMLYDVLTKKSAATQISRDSTWALKQGATEIRRDSFYRAAALYVELPIKGKR